MTVHTPGTDSSTHPAEVAQQETSRVTQEAAQQARDLAGQLKSQVSEQAEAQRGRAAEGLRSLGDGLQRMADSGEGPGPAHDLVSEIAGRARAFADYVESRDAGQLLDEARDLARRKPMAFLAGAAVAGAVVGRLSRGALSAATGENSGTGRRVDGSRTGVLPPATEEGYIDLSASTGTAGTATTYSGSGLVGGTVPEAAATSPTVGVDTGSSASGAGGTGVGAGAEPRSTAAGSALEEDFAGESTLGPLGQSGTTQPPRASGTEGSFHG
jgi:hypothetical protein